MPMPKDTPAVFIEIIADYRHGTIDRTNVQKRIADAIKAEPGLQKFKDDHLAWTAYDDAVEWI